MHTLHVARSKAAAAAVLAADCLHSCYNLFKQTATVTATVVSPTHNRRGKGMRMSSGVLVEVLALANATQNDRRIQDVPIMCSFDPVTPDWLPGDD